MNGNTRWRFGMVLLAFGVIYFISLTVVQTGSWLGLINLDPLMPGNNMAAIVCYNLFRNPLLLLLIPVSVVVGGYFAIAYWLED